jgi:hypothetical protein
MTIAGIGWYRKDQWEHLRRISADQDQLEATWEEWTENAERMLIKLMKEGCMPQKVPIDVSELELWCRARNRPCDGAARSEYVIWRMNSK